VPVLPPSEDEKIIASFMEPSAGAEGQLGGLGILRTPRTGRESDTKRLPAPRNRDECPGINKSVPQPSMVGKGATFWGEGL